MNDQGEIVKPINLILSISAVSLNFDFVTSDPSASKADEIRVLLPKNKKPPKGSKEGKPSAFGLPTGQLESKEEMLSALKRETRDETGYPVKQVVGKAFVIYKHWVPNEIHLFLVESCDYPVGVREKGEIDDTIDPWHTLREIFSMPLAQDRDGSNKNPNGIYFSHRQRLFRVLETMLRHPKDMIDGDKITDWVGPNRKHLLDAMADLEEAGLLETLHDQYTHYEHCEEPEEEEVRA